MTPTACAELAHILNKNYWADNCVILLSNHTQTHKPVPHTKRTAFHKQATFYCNDAITGKKTPKFYCLSPDNLTVTLNWFIYICVF